jgi:hypothetical protein
MFGCAICGKLLKVFLYLHTPSAIKINDEQVTSSQYELTSNTCTKLNIQLCTALAWQQRQTSYVIIRMSEYPIHVWNLTQRSGPGSKDNVQIWTVFKFLLTNPQKTIFYFLRRFIFHKEKIIHSWTHLMLTTYKINSTGRYGTSVL